MSEDNLISCHIIHKFHNNNVLFTWSYHSITEECKKLILSSIPLLDGVNNKEIYLKSKNWVYLWQAPVDKDEYKSAIIGLVTKDFNPCKYSGFCRMLCSNYIENQNAVELVKIFLDCIIVNSSLTNRKNGMVSKYDFKNYNLTTNLKELIKQFGLEIILIYTALLLKKRVIVYHSNFIYLQKCLLSFTYLVHNRNINSYLLPLINSAADLQNKSFFMAGIKRDISNLKPNQYDLFVNLKTNTINISTGSKDILSMTKTHKDIAMLLQQLSEEPGLTEEQLVEQLNSKTNDLLTFLNSLSTTTADTGKQMVTIESLRSKNFNKNLENFLFNIAVAENIIIV